MRGKQYQMLELVFQAPAPVGSEAAVDLQADFVHAGDGEKVHVRGFYAGNGVYKVRFLPEKSGSYSYQVSGIVSEEGSFVADEAEKTVIPPYDPAGGQAAVPQGHHGIVRAKGLHFAYEDGNWFYPFGTTVYAFAHQTDELMEETFRTLEKAPFNKIRICVFPKNYCYNRNEPQFYAFRKKDPQDSAIRPAAGWDVNHPDFRFWDAFEEKLDRFEKLGIQVDLILFHPYDRWGFAEMPLADNLTYLDYLLRRFAAYPNLWWSMANEYDLCFAKTLDDWHAIESFLAENDPWHHLLSNHNCLPAYDATRPAITHCSLQVKNTATIVEDYQHYTHKPVMVDECLYEGNLIEPWGSISGKEMTMRFWQVCTSGGYATHGETFMTDDLENQDNAVIWWAKGGKLIGESPSRIGWLRGIIESFGEPLEAVENPQISWKYLTKEEREEALRTAEGPGRKILENLFRMTEEEFTVVNVGEHKFEGHVGEHIFLSYYGYQTYGWQILHLPKDRKYRVEVLDTFGMTRELVLEKASGDVTVKLPGREYMAVLATEVTDEG